MTLKKDVIKFLRESGELTITDLTSHFGEVPVQELIEILTEGERAGYIEFKGGKWRLKYVFLPVIKRAPKYRDYQLSTLMQGVDLLPAPDNFFNPNVEVLKELGYPKPDQSDRGTCVGWAGSLAYLDNLLRITGHFPTKEEIAKARRGVLDANGVLHDIYAEEHTISAEGIYQTSKAYGHVAGEGSYTRLGVEIVRIRGVVLENQWHTATRPTCTNVTPAPASQAEIDATMLKHRVEGSAIVSPDLNSIKRAISTYGGVWGSILIYDNYMDGFPSKLVPGSQEIGSHSIFMCGYQTRLDDTYVCFWTTWKDWDWYIWMPWAFLSSAYMDGFVLLDTSEREFIEANQCEMTFASPVPAKVYIDGEYHGDTPAVAFVEINKVYQIKFVAEDGRTDTRDIQPAVAALTLTAVFDPLPSDPVPDPVQPVSLWELIKRFIIALFRIR